MQYCNKFYKKRYRKALKGLQRAIYKADIDATAQKREKVILFYQKHGYKLTQEAFGVKRYTLFNWQGKI
jgi:DNA invertase Pin-like site-specific DNA recombinase